MDVSPIVRIFDSLLSAGAAVALAATAFFVMLAGFQSCPPAAACARSSRPKAACTTR